MGERALRLDGGRTTARRGRLLDCHQVADIVGRSADWVLRNVPGKIDLGHSTKRWYEDEIWDWVASRREDG